jgi:ribosomal protein L29
MMPLITLIKGYSERDLGQEYERGRQQGCATTLDELKRELADLDIPVEHPVLLPVLRTADILTAVARRCQSDQTTLIQANIQNQQLQRKIEQLQADLTTTSIPELREQVADLQVRLSTARQQLTAQISAQATNDQAQATRLTELQRQIADLRTTVSQQAKLIVLTEARQQKQPQ